MRAVALAGVVALMAAFTGTAHAAPNYEGDGYEGNYGERWYGNSGTSTPAGVVTGGIETDGVNAHEGSNNGWLYAAGGWVSQSRRIDVSGWTDRTDCEARIMAKPRDFEANPTLQVWNPNGWVRLGSDGVRYLPPDEYTQVVTTRFDLSGVDVVFVEALLGNGSPHQGRVVRFDLLELECF